GPPASRPAGRPRHAGGGPRDVHTADHTRERNPRSPPDLRVVQAVRGLSHAVRTVEGNIRAARRPAQRVGRRLAGGGAAGWRLTVHRAGTGTRGRAMSAEAEDARSLRELDATYPEDAPMVADSLPRGPGLFQIGTGSGQALVTNIRRIAGRDTPPGERLIAAATILLGGLPAGF